jgi:hypothetical protein
MPSLDRSRKEMKIAFHAKPISGVQEDQIPMTAKCYELPDGNLYLLYEMKGTFPFGRRIRPEDLELNHPEFPGLDGFYRLSIDLGMDLQVDSEIDTSSWTEVDHARYL